MINPQWLELPISRTNFHGPKDVRAIEVQQYLDILMRKKMQGKIFHKKKQHMHKKQTFIKYTYYSDFMAAKLYNFF